MSGLEDARSALEQLEGRRFTAVGRAATLVWFAFGDEVPWVDFRGQDSTRPELALHVQCRWRLLRDGEIVVDQRDLSVPAVLAGDGFAEGKIGSLRFDERVKTLAEALEAERPVVESVVIDEWCGLWLTLSSGRSLEVFPAGREGWEDWRFLQFAGPSAGQHHVVVEDGSIST